MLRMVPPPRIRTVLQAVNAGMRAATQPVQHFIRPPIVVGPRRVVRLVIEGWGRARTYIMTEAHLETEMGEMHAGASVSTGPPQATSAPMLGAGRTLIVCGIAIAAWRMLRGAKRSHR